MRASAALARMSCGPGASGKPWPRLMAPCSRARPDMVSKIEVGIAAKVGFKGEGLRRLTGQSYRIGCGSKPGRACASFRSSLAIGGEP